MGEKVTKDGGGGTEKGGRFGSWMRDGRVAKKGYVFTFPYLCLSPERAQAVPRRVTYSPESREPSPPLS